MSSLDFEKEKTAFRAYYDNNIQLLKDAEELFKSLVNSLLSRAGNLEPPQVVSRLKDRDGSIEKFSRKYQARLEQRKTPYEIKDYIRDLIGLRVVCLYADDVPFVTETLKREFQVLDETNKTGRIESTEGTFGYKGSHLNLRINASRSSLPEYERFAGIQFEVQIRSTIQDAWSVLDHKLKYKKSIPISLKRRINRLAALFELADEEFSSINGKNVELLKQAESALSGVTGEEHAGEAAGRPAVAAKPALPLSVFSFIPIARAHFPDYLFSTAAADSFVHDLLEMEPAFSIGELEAVLRSHLPAVKKYAQATPYRLNPYTQIRHCLYLLDAAKYKFILFDLQRENFEAWLKLSKE